jgi:hypothetical protein
MRLRLPPTPTTCLPGLPTKKITDIKLLRRWEGYCAECTCSYVFPTFDQASAWRKEHWDTAHNPKNQKISAASD